jgi:hypothetical protein
MTSKQFAVAAILVLQLTSLGSAQSASELLQKGLHLQEAAGDVDGAILFFRQVISSAVATNKPLAAQAQYQLVLCMLQKGDREAARKELAALENNFPNMTDLVDKARKLIPGSAALVPSPWGETECSQLNIKRDGKETGEYLYYSLAAWSATASEQNRKAEAANLERNPLGPNQEDPNQTMFLWWQLKTKNSERSIWFRADRDTLQRAKPRNSGQTDFVPQYSSNDDLGDPLAIPFRGPATDSEESVFLLRRLPLEIGYKTTIPVTSDAIAPVQMELVVTGIESVETPAGRFNCYKISFKSIGQTLWIGVDKARPLVKFQSGNVEANLVKVWGAENPMEPIARVVKAAGGKMDEPLVPYPDNPYPDSPLINSIRSSIHLGIPSDGAGASVTIHKIYTPPSELAQTLQRAMQDASRKHPQTSWNGDYQVRPESVQTREIGGHPALTCLLDYTTGSPNSAESPPQKWTRYEAWIATEDEVIEFRLNLPRDSVGTFRWRFEPILTSLRIP